MREETTYDIGESVVCDYCNSDEHNDAQGGLLFGSSAICPTCQPKAEHDIKYYHEEQYIKARANDGETFREFVLRIRGGNNTVRIVTGDSLDEILD